MFGTEKLKLEIKWLEDRSCYLQEKYDKLRNELDELKHPSCIRADKLRPGDHFMGSAIVAITQDVCMLDILLYNGDKIDLRAESWVVLDEGLQ